MNKSPSLQKGMGELFSRASTAEPAFFTNGCISNENLLEIMRGNSGCLEDAAVQDHLESCSHCRDLVEYAKAAHLSYDREKQHFLTAIEMNKSRTGFRKWLLKKTTPIRVVVRPNIGWAFAAILAFVLGSIPFITAPHEDDPEMVNALKKIAGLPVEDVESAKKMAAQIKSASAKGERAEPTAMHNLREAVEEKVKLDSVEGSQELSRGWNTVLGDLNTADFLNQYQRITTASGSVDSLQNLDVKDARVEDHAVIVEIAHIPRDREFESLVRQANLRAGLPRAGLEQVTIKGPSNFVLRVK
jgi:hypothetical protein